MKSGASIFTPLSQSPTRLLLRRSPATPSFVAFSPIMGSPRMDTKGEPSAPPTTAAAAKENLSPAPLTKPSISLPILSPPEKPEPGDCCGSGCVRCVWDIYYDELEAYNRSIVDAKKSDDDEKS